MGITIKGEKVLLDLERDNGEHFRFVAVKAKTDEGRELIWYSVQSGPAENGAFQPKWRVTVRGRELQPLFQAIKEAIQGPKLPPGVVVDEEQPAPPQPADEKKEVPY